MRDDYKLQGPTTQIEIEVESRVSEELNVMSDFTQLTVSELTNTALKRFISQHKDFLPPEKGGIRY